MIINKRFFGRPYYDRGNPQINKIIFFFFISKLLKNKPVFMCGIKIFQWL